MERLGEDTTNLTLSENTTAYVRYVECIFDDMYLPRTISMVVLSLIATENALLLIAIFAHWPKFRSNLYKFVTSLVCSDILIAVSNMAVLILKTTDAGNLHVTAFLKGAAYVSFLVSTLSLSFINVSARLTYARSEDTLAQLYNAERHRSYRFYLRKGWVAKLIIVAIWGVALSLTMVALVTKCTKQDHDCAEDCATVLLDSRGKQQTLCKTAACSRFWAPLSMSFVLLLNLTSWCGFSFLVITTALAVFVKVKIVPVSDKCQVSVTSSSKNSNTTSTEYVEIPLHKTRTVPETATTTIQNIPVEAQVAAAKGHIIVAKSKGTSTNSVFAAKRTFGFNRDFLSKFSLTVTCLQLLFWGPVTVLTLRGFITQSSYTGYFKLELINNVFFVPSLLDPWILVLTMSKLRDAISSTYLGRCKCYST